MPRTSPQAQFGHQQGRDTRRRRPGAYRHRRRRLRPRSLVGYRWPTPRLHRVPLARQPRPAQGFRHGAQAARRRRECRRPVRPRRVGRAGLPVGRKRRLRCGVRRNRVLARRIGPAVRGFGRRSPAQRPRCGDRGAGHRPAVEESAADRGMAQGPSRDRRRRRSPGRSSLSDSPARGRRSCSTYSPRTRSCGRR